MPSPAKRLKANHPQSPQTSELPAYSSLTAGHRTLLANDSTKDAIEISLATHNKPVNLNRYLPPASLKHTSTHDPVLLFTPGAGGDHNDAPTRAFCTGYSESAECISIKGNLNLKARVKTLDAVVDWTEVTREVVVGGRSMGARAAVMVASSREEVVKVVCVSYPLRGEKADLRDGILVDLPAGKEVLFVVGGRDEMCDLAELEEVRRRMVARSSVVVVQGAKHGMEVSKDWGEEGADVTETVRMEVGRVVARWVKSQAEWSRRKTMRWNCKSSNIEVVDDVDGANDDHAQAVRDRTEDGDGIKLDTRARSTHRKSKRKREDEGSTCTRQLRPRKVDQQ